MNNNTCKLKVYILLIRIENYDEFMKFAAGFIIKPYFFPEETSINDVKVNGSGEGSWIL